MVEPPAELEAHQNKRPAMPRRFPRPTLRPGEKHGTTGTCKLACKLYMEIIMKIWQKFVVKITAEFMEKFGFTCRWNYTEHISFGDSFWFWWSSIGFLPQKQGIQWSENATNAAAHRCLEKQGTAVTLFMPDRTPFLFRRPSHFPGLFLPHARKEVLFSVAERGERPWRREVCRNVDPAMTNRWFQIRNWSVGPWKLCAVGLN